MSNRSFASQYNGAPNVGHSSGGGSDLFGLQAKRQKDIMMLQQAQELEKMQKSHDYATQETAQEGDIKSKAAQDAVGLKLAEQNGLVPPGTSLDSLSKEQRDAINQYGMTHLALQQKMQDSPEYQDSFVKGGAALAAKPAIDNNEAKARAQALSTTVVPPNTGVRVGAPGGDFATKPQDFFGGTQQTQVVGGIKNPATGEMIGGHPVETYGRPQFPSVGKIDLGDSQNLTNNVQAKPTPLDNSVAGPLGTSFATQPPIATNPILTKPSAGPGMIDSTSPGPATILNLLKYLQSTNNPGGFQGSKYPSTF